MGWFGGRPPLGWYAQVYRRTGLDEVHIVCEGDAVPAFTPERARQPTECAGAPGDPIPGPVVLFEPSFRSPYAFKASIGGDARLPGGVVLTTDIIYIRGGAQLSLSDHNLLPPAGRRSGEAGRPLFGTIDSAGGHRDEPADGRVRAVVALGSRSRDRSLAFSVQAEKRLGNGATITASYTYTDARDLLSATQDDLDAVVDSTTVGSPLEHALRPTGWSAPHRVTLLVAADLPLHFAVSFFYAGQSGSPFTYSVAGDANADGYINDPIYVPADIRAGGDISLVVDDGQGGFVPASSTDYQHLAVVPEPSRALSVAPVRPADGTEQLPQPVVVGDPGSLRAHCPARPTLAHAYRRRLQPAESAQRPLGSGAELERSPGAAAGRLRPGARARCLPVPTARPPPGRLAGLALAHSARGDHDLLIPLPQLISC